MEISITRLMRDIEQYARHGQDPNGGITRPSFSEEDYVVREMFIKDVKELDMQVTVDGAANIWGRLKGNGTKQGVLVVGSHLDTVPNGGKYDGALGVLMALELIRTLKDHEIQLDHDIEIISFTAEEPNDFNVSTMGSRSLTGKLTPDMLRDVKDSKGLNLTQAFERAGGGLHHFEAMRESAKDKKAYLELHIEQGQRLEGKDLAVAVVDSIVGIYRDQVTVKGEANHAGTTMMQHRTDSLTATAELILAVEKVCREHPSDTVGTVGKLEVFPNAANIIPGKTEFILELRGENDGQIQELLLAIEREWQEIMVNRKVEEEREKPVRMDEDMIRILKKAADRRKEEYLTLPSMAGHDASHMADISKSVMIFVKSINGKSHCPDEYSTADDIEKVGNVMLESLLMMDKELE